MRKTASISHRVCYFLFTTLLAFGVFHSPAMADQPKDGTTLVNLRLFAAGDLPEQEQNNVVIQALDHRTPILNLNDPLLRGEIAPFKESAYKAIYTRTIKIHNPRTFNLSLLEIDLNQLNPSQTNAIRCRQFHRLEEYLNHYLDNKNMVEKLDIDIFIQAQYRSDRAPAPSLEYPGKNIYNDYSDCEVTFKINGIDYPEAMPTPTKVNLRLFASGDLQTHLSPQANVIVQTVDDKIKMSPRNDVRQLGDAAPYNELADKPIYARTIAIHHPRSFNVWLVEVDAYQPGSSHVNVVNCRKYRQLNGYLKDYLRNNPNVDELNIDLFMQTHYQSGRQTQSPADPKIFIDENSTCEVSSFKINGVNYHLDE